MNVSISEIHSKPFDCPISDIPYVEMAKEVLKNNLIEANETGYFRHIFNLLKVNKNVWNCIYTKDDCLKRANEFISIAHSIKKHGFIDKNNIRHIKGLPYGKITFMNIKGKITLIDGHHRMAILICLGFTEFELRHNYLIPIRNGIE